MSGISNPDTILMDSDKVVTATFDTTAPMIYTLTIVIDGTGVGTVAPSVGTHSYLSGTVAPISATVGLNSTFDGWNGNLSGLTNPTSITMDGHKTVTATFNAITVVPTYTLSLQVVGQGDVHIAPDKDSYTAGEIVALTAQPAAGWQFAAWSGAVSGATELTTVTMNADRSVTATFTELPQLTSGLVGLKRVTPYQFDADGNIYGPFMDDILYDPIPPQITAVSISTTHRTVRRAAASVLIRVTASDDLGGIDRVYLGHTPDPASAQAFTPAQAGTGVAWTVQNSGVVYAWARDRAGNLSTTEPTQGKVDHKIYLPLVVRD